MNFFLEKRFTPLVQVHFFLEKRFSQLVSVNFHLEKRFAQLVLVNFLLEKKFTPVVQVHFFVEIVLHQLCKYVSLMKMYFESFTNICTFVHPVSTNRIISNISIKGKMKRLRCFYFRKIARESSSFM